MSRPGRPPMATLRNLLTTTLAVAVGTTAYYLLPLRGHGAATLWTFVAAFACGLLVVAAAILVQVVRYRSPGRHRASVAGVVAALYLAVLFFAAVYYGLATHVPSSIASLRTKTDALYYSLAITSTAGFGDVRSVSQLARAVTAVHMAFNIGYLGVVVAVLRGSDRR